jgi:mannose-6-phosphate isomerase-like protein (cupin superfamily)
VLGDAQGVRVLDGNCFVASSKYAPVKPYQNTKWAVLISALQGSVHQSLHYLSVAADGKFSPNFSMAESEISLLLSKGEGEIVISNKQFQLSKHDGVYIRSGEIFSLRTSSSVAMELHLSVCPQYAKPIIVGDMLDNFDSSYPERVVPTDEAANQGVGDRFFQILVGKATGSTRLTQFIGRIPTSMAAFHRHLYEESLVVLEGRGHMWSDTLKCEVRAGDIIFLPRKQLHSLQCDSADGMVLVGFIYPGDNPAINY